MRNEIWSLFGGRVGGGDHDVTFTGEKGHDVTRRGRVWSVTGKRQGLQVAD